jgi:hypothetical protein
MADGDWRFLQRARDWYLAGADGQRKSVGVLKLENQKALELNLTKTQIAPGEYRVGAFWDWSQFEVTGTVHVLPLSDLSSAHLQPESQDRLVAKSGKIPVTVTGSDFEFATRVQLKKSGDEFALPVDSRFILPKGLREGPQDHMDVQIDAANLDPGAYQLLIEQQGGTISSVPVKILPNPPKVTNLPIVANQGAGTQHYVLKGERLGDILKMEAQGATVDLGATSAGDSERNITVRLNGAPDPSRSQPIKVYLKNRTAPLTFPHGIEISGPLPVIVSSKLSPPTGVAVTLRPSEFPAGATLSGVLDVKNISPGSTLTLACAAGNWQSAGLTVGGETSNWSLQQISSDQLFFSYDTGLVPAGCDLEARIDNEKSGQSKAFPLVKLIRVPKIDAITAAAASDTQGTASPGSSGFYLEGKGLEMIAKVAWNSAPPAEVTALPAPIPGEGQRQRLAVPLERPTEPSSALTIWVRGDAEGRPTTLKYEIPTTPDH